MRIISTLIAHVLALSVNLSALELCARSHVSDLPVELVKLTAVSGDLSPAEYLSNLSRLACANKKLSELLSTEVIVDLYYDHYKTRLGVQTCRRSGNTIAHLLAQHRKYQALNRLIDKCQADHNTTCLTTRNHAADSVFLTLLRYKSAKTHSTIFDNIFKWFLAQGHLEHNHASHDLMINSPELTKKLTAEQRSLLNAFDKAPPARPKLSQAFINAMEGDVTVFKKQKNILNKIKRRQKDVFDFTNQGFFKYNILHIAARNGHADYLKHLLSKAKARKYINSHNGHQATPLITAAKYGRIKCLSVLIESGADIEARDKENKTAILRAAGLGQLAAVIFLLDHGARIDIVSKGHGTILDIAERHNHAHIIDHFLKNKIVPNMIHGDPLASFAAFSNLPGLISKLKLNGYDIEERSHKDGSTPLIVASHHGCVAAVKMLIELGAHPCAVDNKGNSATSHTCNKQVKDSCAQKHWPQAVEISILLANAIKKKAKDISFDDKIRAYIMMKDNGFFEGAQIIAGCFDDGHRI